MELETRVKRQTVTKFNQDTGYWDIFIHLVLTALGALRGQGSSWYYLLYVIAYGEWSERERGEL